jgi:hypothetical protein
MGRASTHGGIAEPGSPKAFDEGAEFGCGSVTDYGHAIPIRPTPLPLAFESKESKRPTAARELSLILDSKIQALLGYENQ